MYILVRIFPIPASQIPQMTLEQVLEILPVAFKFGMHRVVDDCALAAKMAQVEEVLNILPMANKFGMNKVMDDCAEKCG